MSDTTPSTMEFELPLGVRMRLGVRRTHVRFMVGVRHPGNWLQLIRFGAVGASGYVVNLAVFAACVHLLRIDYRLASAIAFLVSVGNNFWLNRHWTFSAKEHHPGRQAIKFFAVSLVAYGFSYVLLTSLVDDAGLDKVIAQAIAVVAAMPLSFIGQKLWSFRA
ncbi:MAG TPA: GtrA family protein [Solirubrobacteraceae bacterium]|jgi:dolichol-phosphate mannosyltransferase|nr:GtrA family protein [Solirubrobacteraceae bacterium]